MAEKNPVPLNISRRALLTGLALSPFGARHGLAAAPFADPAPPKASIPPAMPAPAATVQPELHFHAAPRPLSAGAITHDWRSFGGPSFNSVSTETPLLQQFGKGGPAVVWEVTRGEGFSPVAAVGDRVLLFHRVGDRETLECLHAETGRRFWKLDYPTDYTDRYGANGGPRCQPVSDGEFVYAYGVGGVLQCVKLTTGQVCWRRELNREFQVKLGFFGVGATPLLEGDRLIINLGAPGGPCVVAFDKHTGKMVWGAGEQWGPSYASPIPATVHGKRRVFVFAGGESRPATGGLLCLDPADGKVAFSFPWRARVYESVNASCPLVVGNQVFISECYGPGGTLLEVTADGSFRQVWASTDLGTHFMTAIHQEGYLYGIDGHGPQGASIVCQELATGKEMWRHLPEWKETIHSPDGDRKVDLSSGLSSLLRVDGRCLLFSDMGTLAWLDLNPKGYRELSRTQLFVAPESFTPPTLSRGLLYVSQTEDGLDGTKRRLLCYDLRGEKKA